MVITKEILYELTAKAKENPRLRCNLDMRNSADDQSQRRLNVLGPVKGMYGMEDESTKTTNCVTTVF